ncbi:unnamed protein product [Rotaria sp. Silwood2]|nr:unnamed protein product [Rotaria sp. Silwood2]
MAKLCIILQFIISSLVIENSRAISSPLAPYTTYKHSIELQKYVADLWWTVDDNEQEITFELHMKTTGWIALGISPAGGMTGADIAVGWVDQTGSVHLQDRYASADELPIFDNTTIDWFAVKGREVSGWTAIQFKRLLDTCDIMDVPIKSGTNILIFAYAMIDPVPSGPNGEISYHGSRRGSRALPLRSYVDPPSEDIFAGLDYVEFRLNNYVVPPTDTTDYCKIYKVPSSYSVKRHAIGHKTIVDSASQDLVHHLLMYECDSTAQFNDNNLPAGLCDQIYQEIAQCTSNIANGWAVGGDYMVAFPKEAGYPIGGDFPIKYYMVQVHYDNPNLLSNRTDNSGIRFYIGKELRQYDLGLLTFGTDSSAVALAIPPKAQKFIVDSYCSANATMGGEKIKDEICLHRMIYYPRMNNMYGCMNMNSPQAWLSMMNTSSSSLNYTELQQWLLNLTWTPERAVQWQEFYNTVSRVLIYGAAPNLQFDMMPSLPKYEDLKPVPCTKDPSGNKNTTRPSPTTFSQGTTTNKAISYVSTIRQDIFVFLNLILIVMTVIFM